MLLEDVPLSDYLKGNNLLKESEKTNPTSSVCLGRVTKTEPNYLQQLQTWRITRVLGFLCSSPTARGNILRVVLSCRVRFLSQEAAVFYYLITETQGSSI